MIPKQLIIAIRLAFGTGLIIGIKMAYKYGIIDYAMFVYASIVLIMVFYVLIKKWKKRKESS